MNEPAPKSLAYADDARGHQLFGRESECLQLGRLLGDARLRVSGVLVVTGEPGIGKTALCRWAASCADGMQLLRVRAVESELDLPFAGLSELFGGHLDRIALLPEPQGRALEVAFSRRRAASGERFAIGAAVLGMLGAIADAGPVLAVIDDAQWLDASSASALIFAARRLGREGVALIVATRPGSVFDDASNGLPRLTLRGLTESAARALVHAVRGPMPPAVAHLVVSETAGNPLAVMEGLGQLTTVQLAGERPITEPLPVGASLVSSLLPRVSGLPEETRLALVVAAATGAERIDPVIRALTALSVDHDVLDAAERAGAIRIEDGGFEFRHPLLRSAVYHGAAAAERRRAHRALADATSGESRAWHLAHSTLGADESVALAMEEVGFQARGRGAPSAAAAAFDRAATLSGSTAARVRRRIEAARDSHVAGQPKRAIRLLEEALTEAPDPLTRAHAHHLRGRILVMQRHRAAACAVLAEEGSRIRELDPDLSATMVAEACLDGVIGGDVEAAARDATTAWTVASHAGPAVQAFAGAMLAFVSVVRGDRRRATALLERITPVLRTVDPLSEAGMLVTLAAQSYFWLERHDLAGRLLTHLIASARAASAPAALLLPLCPRGELDLRTGRWSVADGELEEATRLAEDLGQTVHAAYALEIRARLAAARGEEERCGIFIAQAMPLIEEHGNELGRLYIHSARGLLEFGVGRIDTAVAALERARELATRSGFQEPNVVHWQADLVEAYVHAGATDAAEESLAAFERQATVTGGSWALGTAARCRGLLTEGARRDVAFTTALRHLQAMPFEIARTHLCRGEQLRRAGRATDAREALELALNGFSALEAHPWRARAEREIRATGKTRRPRRSAVERETLTAHELQIARIVAGGATNREAAAALFLSPKTIEFHLARVYRKLGVRTRTELAALAAQRGWFDDTKR
jgi:DNA-binding CsgD family transcriptional regulator